MRRLLLLLLVIPLVSATFDPIIETIKVGDKIDHHGRVVELLSVSESGQILVRVDNTTTRPITDIFVVDGVRIQILETFYVADPDERIAKINMTVQWRHLCNTDEDCISYISNPCIIEVKCSGWPRSCEHDDSARNITECIDNDNCCPLICIWLSDDDCDKPCHKDRDCNDNDPGTIDICSGTVSNPGFCEYVPITYCKSWDDFCPVGCDYGYISGKDLDCSKNNTCSYGWECEGDLGTTGACMGYGTDDDPRKCVYSNVTACILNDGFCPSGCTELNDNDCPHVVMCGDWKCEDYEDCGNCVIDCGCSTGLVCIEGECLEEVRVCDNIGERTNLSIGGDFYCSERGWKILKAGGSVCKNDYECRSSLCGSNEKCVSVVKIKEGESKKFALMLLGAFLVAVAVYFIVLYKISRKAKGF